MRKFKIEYYKLEKDGTKKVVTDEISARTLKIQNGMAIFYENGCGEVVVAAYSDFISVKGE
jgi:hypothetical protein